MILWLTLAVALLFLAAHLLTVGLFLRRLRPNPVQPGTIGTPRVTLLRPVCGLDPFDAETLGSSFTQDYPDYEVIFCAPGANDPAIPLVRALIAAHPQIPAQLLVGQVAITGNPKLNNLWNGWQAASADWVCMTDSNLLLPPDYLRRVVASWGPDTGLVSSPPTGSRPAGLAASLECAMLNSNQARLQFAGASLGWAFAQGKTLFWNRDMLNKAGGIAALGRYLAEDVNATKLVRAAGLRVSLTPLPFAQPIGRRDFATVWNRQLRWSRVRRDGFPLVFATEVFNGAAVPFVAAGIAAVSLHSPLLFAAYVALWYGAEVVLIARAGWPHGWRDVLALPLRDAMLPALWAATFLQRGIEWRGTPMAPPAAPTEPVLDQVRPQ